MLRVRFELAVKDETEITDRLEQVQSTELLQTLVVAAAHVESLETFRNILDKEVPSTSSSQKECPMDTLTVIA